MATKKLPPVDDGRKIPGHVCTCDGCGVRGVYCHTTTGIVTGCRETFIDFGNDLVPLLAGREDGSDSDGLYCDDCATVTH